MKYRANICNLDKSIVESLKRRGITTVSENGKADMLAEFTDMDEADKWESLNYEAGLIFLKANRLLRPLV